MDLARDMYDTRTLELNYRRPLMLQSTWCQGTQRESLIPNGTQIFSSNTLEN